MTESEYKAAHIALWDWMFRHPSKDKGDWPGWESNGGEHEDYYSGCFACEFCRYRCTTCPLTFRCYDYGSLYEKWTVASTPRTRKKYAAIIRDAWREIRQ